jgi:hypothetical protein
MTWSVVEDSGSKVSASLGLHMLSLTCCNVKKGTSCCPLQVISICFYQTTIVNKKKKKKKLAWKVNTVSITHMSMKANIRRISSHINCFFFFKVLNRREKSNPKEKPIYILAHLFRFLLSNIKESKREDAISSSLLVWRGRASSWPCQSPIGLAS